MTLQLQFCSLAVVISALLAGVPKASAAAALFDPRQGYDQLLADHVDPEGWVDYAGLAENRAALDRYAASLADADLQDLPRDERLATLINAYNAFTLQLILDHWGRFESGKIDSITDLHGGQPWDQKIWELGGTTVSLNQLEHVWIRPVFDEPRIHWALVCAAYSCPPLRSEAYTAEQLEQQLAEQEAYVLRLGQPRFVQLRDSDSGAGRLSVTPLFDWYGEDFNDGDWQTYLLDRLDPEVAERRPAFGPFLPYNWSLNSQDNRPDGK
jgi:hypothetical protein